MTGIAKLDGVKAYLADIFENDEKFIVFGFHKQVLDGIEEECKKA